MDFEQAAEQPAENFQDQGESDDASNIGEDYDENTYDDYAEGDDEGDDEGSDEGSDDDGDDGDDNGDDGGDDVDQQDQKQAPKRSVSETKKLASEFYGIPQDKIIVTKNGDVRIIMKMDRGTKLVNPHDLPKGFNLNQVGYKRLDEAKTKEKQMESLWKRAQEDPDFHLQLMEKMGHNTKEIAKRILEKEVARSEMSEEERRAIDLEEKLKKLEKEKEHGQKQEQLRVFTEQKEQAKKKFESDLTSAMVKQGFKDSTVKAKANILKSAVTKMQIANHGGRTLSADDAVRLAKEEWQESVINTFGDIDENQIIQILPESVIKAIRKADTRTLKDGIPDYSGGHDQRVDVDDVDEIDHGRHPGNNKRKKQVSMADYFEQFH